MVRPLLLQHHLWPRVGKRCSVTQDTSTSFSQTFSFLLDLQTEEKNLAELNESLDNDRKNIDSSVKTIKETIDKCKILIKEIEELL